MSLLRVTKLCNLASQILFAASGRPIVEALYLSFCFKLHIMFLAIFFVVFTDGFGKKRSRWILLSSINISIQILFLPVKIMEMHCDTIKNPNGFELIRVDHTEVSIK